MHTCIRDVAPLPPQADLLFTRVALQDDTVIEAQYLASQIMLPERKGPKGSDCKHIYKEDQGWGRGQSTGVSQTLSKHYCWIASTAMIPSIYIVYTNLRSRRLGRRHFGTPQAQVLAYTRPTARVLHSPFLARTSEIIIPRPLAPLPAIPVLVPLGRRRLGAAARIVSPAPAPRPLARRLILLLVTQV